MSTTKSCSICDTSVQTLAQTPLCSEGCNPDITEELFY